MTTDLLIHLHGCDSLEDCERMIDTIGESPVVVPAFPLVLNNHPNTLPIRYFFNDIVPNNSQFLVFDAILDALYHHATCDAEALIGLCQDVFKLLMAYQPMNHTIEWLHTVVELVINGRAFRQWRDARNAQLKRASHWINHHCDAIIFIGVGDGFESSMRQLVQWVSSDVAVHWIALGVGESRSVDRQSWGRHGLLFPQVSFPHIMHEFETMDVECQAVVDQINQNPGQDVLVVVPSRDYQQCLMSMCHRYKIAVDSDQPIRLADTAIGWWWELVITWVRSQKLADFQAILRHPMMHGYGDIAKRLRHRLEKAPYYLSGDDAMWQTNADIFANGDERIQQLFGWRIGKVSMPDCIAIHKGLMPAYSELRHTYRDYLACHRMLEAMVLGNEQRPMRYIPYILTQTLVETMPTSSVRCCLPDQVFQWPDMPIMVCGVGEESWRKISTTGHYLNHALDNRRDDDQYRGFRRWMLSLPSVVWVSSCSFWRHSVNPTPSDIDMCVRSVSTARQPSQVYTRRSLHLTHSVPMIAQASPSSLEHYQSCPYAYFLKRHLGITVPVSNEYLVFGTLFHRALDIVLTHQKLCWSVIQHNMADTCNALTLQVVWLRLNSDEWQVSDLIHTLTTGQIDTESAHEISVGGIGIRGRMDILHRSQSGVRIIDVKTGTPPSLAHMRRCESIQLGLYACMIGDSVVGASYFSKKNGLKDMLSMENMRHQLQLSDYLPTVKAHVNTLIQRQQENRYGAHDYMCNDAYHHQACQRCEYQSICYFERRTE